MSEPRGPVVVGVDGSQHSLHALETALVYASGLGLPLHVVHVNDITPAKLHLAGNVTVDTREIAEAQRQEIWAMTKETVGQSAVKVEYVGIEGSPAAAGLIDHCETVAASVLVIGTAGRSGLGRMFVGSTAHNAVNQAPCDVLVVRPQT